MPRLSLTATGYKNFIKEFRQADISQTADTDIVVTYNEQGLNRTFYYKTPNFKFYKWNDGTTDHVMLNYNHVGLSGDLKKSALTEALRDMVGTGMTKNHSILVAMTSEAARSDIVYKHMMSAIANGKTYADYFRQAEILFKNYKRTGEQAGMLLQDTSHGYYTSHWKPLRWENYQRVFAGDTSKKGGDFRTFQQSFPI